ncbi:TBC1 domain family member 10A [Electrophorus electricus]|uniref:TBC1 domain family member 10A n=1 Tax=Electrophorus electricus TaxID=8005 RepID=UPI0015D080F2|nr:TBC1 domain family member 10A [Electrophorus electricus]XP_035388157.1 TBC1 domain family member 10A [Electrophorus electricus]XP_035388158.1 TBC1 domain family member 10A [Electrophorus electricus]XP_035388159.1 TBC1 domain family member 10A [Electrophorus electricus]XP_035388160.1 TBC1 domain family member 10A [Electrophorus electricus]
MLRRRSSSSSAKGSRKQRSSSVGFDEFGFALSKKEKKLQHRCHDYSYPQPNAVKVKELCELLSYWNGSSFICRSQIERFIRMGIPPALRGRVWKRLLNIETVRLSSDFSYQACLSEIRKPLKDLGLSEYGVISVITTLGDGEHDVSSDPTLVTPSLTSSYVDAALFREIALDLQRSFPTHRSLMGDSPEAIEGQAKLFRVLTAYAKYNPQIGYSQGMSYIAAVFLMVLDEEEAFWAMVILLEKPKYLSELFDSSLKKIQHQALVFQQLLKHREPQLYQHMEKLGVSSLHFIMQWFLTLFTFLPCWDSVLAIWDLFLLHGVTAVFRAGLAILQLMEARLLSVTEEAAVLPVLLRVPVDISRYCVLIPALWSIEVQEWEINCMTSLILEETTEEHNTRNPVNGSVDPQCSEEQDGQKSAAESPAYNSPCEREAVGSGGKNVFARLLKVAQRYLADTAKHSTAVKGRASTGKLRSAAACLPKERTCSTLSQKRRSQSRQSPHAAVGVVRKEPLPLQASGGGEAEDSGPKLFRRLKSGSVSRVVRKRSGGATSRRARSVAVHGRAPQAQPSPGPASRVQHQASVESRKSPHRNLSQGRTPLAECNGAISPSSANQVRESQLI